MTSLKQNKKCRRLIQLFNRLERKCLVLSADQTEEGISGRIRKGNIAIKGVINELHISLLEFDR